MNVIVSNNNFVTVSFFLILTAIFFNKYAFTREVISNSVNIGKSYRQEKNNWHLS